MWLVGSGSEPEYGVGSPLVLGAGVGEDDGTPLVATDDMTGAFTILQMFRMPPGGCAI
jgi:hypothetical protein